MAVSWKQYVRMDMSDEALDLDGVSSCYFQFNLHPDSKVRRWWLSEEGRCWLMPHVQEEDRLKSTGSVVVDASEMMDEQFSYSMLWDFLSSVPISGRDKHRAVRRLISYAHSLPASCDGFHKLSIITLRLDIDRDYYFLGEEDREDNSGWAAEVEEEECCSICLDDMVKGSTVTRLPCSHVFHGYCIFEWLRDSSSTCPLCRSQVPLITT